MGSKPSFKRQELPTSKAQFCFFLFTLLSFLILGLFLSEEYRAAVEERMTFQNAQPSSGNRVLLNAFTTPMGLTALSIWVLCSLIFARVFNRRLKVMFPLFFSLSFCVVLLFNFWEYFVSLSVASPDSKPLTFLCRLECPWLLKGGLLVFWGLFSVYFCFAAVTAKYTGVFGRLDYLFSSISRGNWDSFMFFRDGDPFSFLAKSFNATKDHYLEEIHRQDECLIALKDKIQADPKNPGLKEELLRLIRKQSGAGVS